MQSDGPDGPRRLAGAVAGTRFRVDWVDETASTNDDLLAAARSGEAEGLVRVADFQTAGRGRLDRRWQAPPGSSLLVSVLLRPPPEQLPTERVHLLTKAVALAARAACASCVDATIALKWPNDLVTDGGAGMRKLGGILAESVVEGDRLAAVVAGIGLNVAWPVDLPADLREIATSLNHLPGFEARFPGRPALLRSVLEHLDRWYFDALLLDGGVELLASYRAACVTLGQPVRVERSADTIEGLAVDVTDDGHLVVEQPGGTRAEIVVGDVVHLRPGPPAR